jgi:hypothetical protein
MSVTVRPRYSVSTAASASVSRVLISSMTAALRWICALDASALVGMLCTSSGGRSTFLWAHYLARAGATGGLRRSVVGRAR